jgi:hypothetical protein
MQSRSKGQKKNFQNTIREVELASLSSNIGSFRLMKDELAPGTSWPLLLCFSNFRTNIIYI